jgi:drug/metabolite transporter (DMT)-like permease
MKRGLDVYTSHQVAALRILIAFLFLLPFGIIHFKRIYPGKKKYFLIVGLFGNFLPAFLFTIAETEISSSLAGLLNSLTPIFTILLGAFFFRMKVNGNQLMGIILGFIGAVMLIVGPGLGGLGSSVVSSLLIVIATISYGISVNVIKKHLSDVPSVTTTFWAFMSVGPLAILRLLKTDIIERVSTQPKALESLGYIAILGIVGTACAVMLFNVLIKRTSAIFASSVTYLIPIVALFWGIGDGETIGIIHICSILVILGGIFLINRPVKAEFSR